MTKISGLPSYTSPIDSDPFPIDDGTNNITKQTTRNQFLTGNPITDPIIKGSSGANHFSGKEPGWVTGLDTYTYAGNNGQKEFLINTNVDTTGYLSVGMKIRLARGTSPPTQCMAFVAASSQSASKASPAGITFTGPFTCEAWIYLNSYTAATNSIISRINGTGAAGGWSFELDSNGRVRIQYGTGSSFTQFASYQSVPLKRWVHVAGVVTSVASKTGQIYINGVSVQTTSPLSASTTLTQSTDPLAIGAYGTTPASTYFDGYISEVRVWSVAQTQASILSNMTINLVGNETNLVSLFKGSGNFNDATTNANNLTATGAISTQANNPYNSIEYGFITKVTSTQLTVFTGTDYNIPNMTLNNFYYSSHRAPYGFPAARGKWMVLTVVQVSELVNIGATNQWWASNSRLTIPIGDWQLGFYANCQLHSTVAGGRVGFVALGGTTTIPTSANNYRQPTISQVAYQPNSTDAVGFVSGQTSVTLTAQDTVVMQASITSASGTEQWIAQYNGTQSLIYAECAYI